MKKETNINSNAKTGKPELNEGLKRKCGKCKNMHADTIACVKIPEHKTSHDISLNDYEVTSSYSNTDPVQKEVIECANGPKEFSSLIFMSKRMNQETNDQYVNKFISQFEDVENNTKNLLPEEQKSHFASVDECLEVIKQNVPQIDRSDLEQDEGTAGTPIR
jgi:hypothetical protein